MPIDDALLALEEPEVLDLVLVRGSDRRFRYEWQARDSSGALLHAISLTALTVQVQAREDTEASTTIFSKTLTVAGDGLSCEDWLSGSETAALTFDTGSGQTFGRKVKIGVYDVQITDTVSSPNRNVTVIAGDVYLWRDALR